MKTTFFKNAMIAVGLATVFVACEADNPESVHETELITTVEYKLSPVEGGSSVTFKFKDIDGDGAMEPMITNGILKPNTRYNGTLTLLNESEEEVEDVTLEIEEEEEEHQVFYVSDAQESNFIIEYADEDEDGNPLGLNTILTTSSGVSTTENLKIILLHEPDKDADGLSISNYANAGGETDIEVTFKVEIKSSVPVELVADEG